MKVLFIGTLCADVPASEQDEVSQTLIDGFGCTPVFLPAELYNRFYHHFCKGYLWPLFHYMLPFASALPPTATAASGDSRLDRGTWEAYVLANKYFEKVVEVINLEDDYVWVHDYHLMALSTFLRHRFNRLRIGFFLHSPFPSSEIYRSLPDMERKVAELRQQFEGKVVLLGVDDMDYL